VRVGDGSSVELLSLCVIGWNCYSAFVNSTSAIVSAYLNSNFIIKYNFLLTELAEIISV